MSPSTRSRTVLVLVALWAAGGSVWSQATQQHLRQRAFSTRGKQTFASTCANCHGLDGKGAERAPNLVDRANVQRLSDAQISHIIENGVPGTGMPAFHSLARSEVQAIVVYLRMLQGKDGTLKLPGDPDRGETIFSGKVGCSGCHMIAGKGGFIASDLSAYAGTHTVEEIRSVIASRTPGGNALQARLVTVTTRGGVKSSGRIRNEDNFSLQLQALDGTFFFLAKSDIENLQYSSQTLMPSDYGSTLSPEDLNDVISYLVREAHVTLEEVPATKDFEDE